MWGRIGGLLPSCPQQDTCCRPRKYREGSAPRPRGHRPVASYPGYTSENGALAADQVLRLDTSEKPAISFRPHEIARKHFSGTSFFLHRQNSVIRLPCGCCFAAPSRLIGAISQERPPAGGYPFDSGHWSCSPHAILKNGGNGHLQGDPAAVSLCRSRRNKRFFHHGRHIHVRSGNSEYQVKMDHAVY